MRRIALINQKGGVGKTTSAANLGASLARLGRRVLLLDIDPQANLSVHFGIDVYSEGSSVYEIICSDAAVRDVIVHSEIEGLDIIPTNIDLAGAEIELVGVVGREIVLREKLAPVLDEYDYLLIDCPPSLGLLTLNALTTVNEIFIPLQTEFFALHGLSKLLETVEIVRRRINPELDVTGIIACLYDSRTNLSQEVLQNIRGYFKDKVFKTLIRKNVRLAEAPSYGKPVIIYDPYAAGAIDYLALAREVVVQEDPPLGMAKETVATEETPAVLVTTVSAPSSVSALQPVQPASPAEPVQSSEPVSASLDAEVVGESVVQQILSEEQKVTAETENVAPEISTISGTESAEEPAPAVEAVGQEKTPQTCDTTVPRRVALPRVLSACFARRKSKKHSGTKRSIHPISQRRSKR